MVLSVEANNDPLRFNPAGTLPGSPCRHGLDAAVGGTRGAGPDSGEGVAVTTNELTRSELEVLIKGLEAIVVADKQSEVMAELVGGLLAGPERGRGADA